MATAVLLISCRDRPGLVHAVAEFVLQHGGNIVHAEQHIDREVGVFFQRVEFDVGGASRAEIAGAFEPVAQRLGMDAQARLRDERPRIAVLASREPHCLGDLLGRWRTGELPAEIVAVVSNHPDHRVLAEFSGVPFHHLPIAAATRADQEAQLVRLLCSYDVELVVLARYMQILGPARQPPRLGDRPRPQGTAIWRRSCSPRRCGPTSSTALSCSGTRPSSSAERRLRSEQ